MNNKIKEVRATALLVLAASVALSATSQAQTGYYVVPSVSVMEGHDDNLFFAIDDEQSSLFTRVSPALVGGYESSTLTWDGRYSFDAESYDKVSSLNSSMVRRFADARFEYLPNERLVLSADAAYTKTNTPFDLGLDAANIIPGLLVGRADAERTLLHPSMEYRFTPSTTALLAYTRTNDKLFGAVESDMDEAVAEGTTALSGTNVVSYGYTYRRFRFDVVPGAGVIANVPAQDSHTPWIGLQHEFGERTTFIGRVGPRIYDNTTKPFVLASLQRAYANGEFLVGYERNESTLLGQVGRVESETLFASLVQRFGQQFEIRFTPGYAETSQQGFEVAIYRLGLQASYMVNDVLSFSAGYDLNSQKVDFIDGSVSEVSRNLITIGFTLTYPARNRTVAR